MVKNYQEFGAGILFLGIGLASLTIAMSYQLGSAARMGPGYFPVLVSLLLIVLGGCLLVKSSTQADEGVALNLRGSVVPAARVALSVITFATTIEQLGLFFATFIAVIVSSFNGKMKSFAVAVVLGIVLASASVFLFVTLLNVQMKMWPWS